MIPDFSTIDWSEPRLAPSGPGEDRWQFAAARSDSTATLDLVEERCIDSMSGARYPFSATLTRNGQELHGCAVEGRPAT